MAEGFSSDEKFQDTMISLQNKLTDTEGALEMTFNWEIPLKENKIKRLQKELEAMKTIIMRQKHKIQNLNNRRKTLRKQNMRKAMSCNEIIAIQHRKFIEMNNRIRALEQERSTDYNKSIKWTSESTNQQILTIEQEFSMYGNVFYQTSYQMHQSQMSTSQEEITVEEM